MWAAVYLSGVAVVALGAWVFSDAVRTGEPISVVAQALWAVVAGILWPVVLLGLAQLLVLRVVVKRLKPASSERSDQLPPTDRETIPVQT